jgi:hypothetical protein
VTGFMRAGQKNRAVLCYNLALVIRSIGGGKEGGREGGRERDALRFSICCALCHIASKFFISEVSLQTRKRARTRAHACEPEITSPQITMKVISITEMQRDVVRSARLSRIRYYPWRGSIWDR